MVPVSPSRDARPSAVDLRESGVELQHPALRVTYSALTNQGFLLRETVEVASRLAAGAQAEDVLKQVKEQDLFQLRTVKSRQTIGSAVLARLDGVPPRLLRLLVDGGSDVQRLTNLYLILVQHRLLRELLLEVVHEALRRLATVVTMDEVNVFIEHKRDQHAAVGGWSDQTLQKARSNMLNVCVSADLLTPMDRSSYAVKAQWVPKILREELKAADREVFLRTLLDTETL